jgi:Na+-driven multidrug efflux pump
MLFIQLLDDEVVPVLAVDVYQHRLDGGITSDQRAWRRLAAFAMPLVISNLLQL